MTSSQAFLVCDPDAQCSTAGPSVLCGPTESINIRPKTCGFTLGTRYERFLQANGVLSR
jgi:hypothetical protein